MMWNCWNGISLLSPRKNEQTNERMNEWHIVSVICNNLIYTLRRPSPPGKQLWMFTTIKVLYTYNLINLCFIKTGSLTLFRIHDSQAQTISPQLTVRPQQRVDPVHDPTEETGVEGFAHGVPHLHRFFHSVGPDNSFSPGHNTVGRQGFLELVWANTQQGRHWQEDDTMDRSQF